MPALLVYALAAFAAALALVPLCRSLALRLGYVAAPKPDRWNRRPTALMGGVAIVAVVLAGGLILGSHADIVLVMIAGGVIAAFGLIDDLFSLKPATKLVVQIGLASALVFFGARLHWVESMTLDAMLTLFWLVGVTNAFNLLDNMDGLAAGVGVIVAATLLVAAVQDGDSGAHAAYLALLIGALAGFLVYNVTPASIFMGDSGSLFIGLTLASLALQPSGDRAGAGVLVVIGAPLLVLLIPIFDTTLVTVARLASGRSPSRGGRDHTSHRLVVIGLSERWSVGILWALAGLGGLVALGLRTMGPDVAVPIALTFVLAMVIFAVYLGQVRVYDSVNETLIASGAITPVVVNIAHKRRAAEVLLDFCLIPLCYYAAYRLRFEGREFSYFFRSFLTSLPIVVALQIVALFAVGGYRGVWRYFGLMDGVVFAKGVVLGTGATVVAIVYFFRFEDYSRSVFIIYAALLMLALCSSRASFRLISEFVRRRRTGRRLLIYGAGDGAALALRELLAKTDHQYAMLGFIDDDPAKHRTRVHGFQVLGGFDSLAALLADDKVDEIVISTKRLDRTKVQRLEDLCTEHGVVLSRVSFVFEQLVAS